MSGAADGGEGLEMVQDLLLELHRRGIRLRLVDGRLDVLAPPGALTPQLREELRGRSDELKALLGRTQAAERGAPGLVAQPGLRHEPFPLTDIQHAYWVGRNPAVALGGVSTHYYVELTADDGLDVPRLAASLRQVIERHDMLRAVITSDGQQQILAEVPPYQIAVADVRDQTPQQQEAELARIRARLAHQVFPAGQWPLFEFRVTRLAAPQLVLHLSIDLLIADGYSLYLLLRDWRRFYEDPGWAPEPLEFSFRDYVLAEQAQREDPQYDRAKEYWLDRLDSLPPAPALPFSSDPAQVSRPVFARRRGSVPRDRWEEIKQQARTRGLTPSTVLMTAFADVLRRWADKPAFTLNLSLFNRPPLHPRIGEVIGDFTSVVLLAVTTPAATPFAVRARVLQQQLMRDLEHVSYSGVQMLRERARRQGSGPAATMPVVFTSVIGHSAPDGPDGGFGLFGGRGFFGAFRFGISQTPQVALDHQVAEDDGNLYFNWDAVQELFPRRLLDDMFAAYCELLDRLSQDAGCWDDPGPLVALPGWQAAERRRANATAVPAVPRTLPELVSDQLARTPEATAVIAHDGQLSYREAAERAHRLAHYLAAQGAGAGSLVAVVMERDRDVVPAVLGVAESGAAYLPINPDWPTARRWQLLDEGRVRLAVTSPVLRDTLSWPADVQPVTFADALVAGAAVSPPPDGPAPSDLAYVIFTSGSTGKPKGVMIEHGSAVNTIVDINSRFGVGPGDRVLALSSLSFDLSVYDVFGTLAAGATAVMPFPGGAHDPAHWDALFTRHQVTVWNSVPALMQAWLDAAGQPAAQPRAGLRLVLLSGDWIPVTQPEAVRRCHPGARVISLGGATEAAIWSIWYPVEEVPPDWTRIPYGKPLANQTMHVLDDQLDDCPVWVTGEIYIGGLGVARGYWADPVRTAERFIVHPGTGERLYRTGDLGRYLPGGDIEFLGRADSQVKLNGHRIELGEIAAVLERQAGVREALATVAANPATGKRQLVAYVVPERHDTAATAAGPGAVRDWPAAVAAAGTEWERSTVALAAELAEYRSMLRAFNVLCVPLIAQTLARLGCFTTAGETLSAHQIVERCGNKLDYSALVGQWLDLLAREGVLTRADPQGRYRCPDGLDPAALDRQVADGLSGLAAHGAPRALADYFTQCARHQVELLRGEVNLREFLLPGGSWEVTEAMYARNPLARLENQVLAETVGSFAAALAADPVRILEVGAGTGATSAEVLARLPAGRCRYSFTDVSLFFTEAARPRLAAYPFVEFRTFDIDGDPIGQGFAPGSADVVVAANVLHNARDLDRTLRSLRSVLESGGLLALIENTENEPFHLVTVGFYQDLGRYQDTRTLPLLTPAGWHDRLLAAGFRQFAAFPGPGDPMGQHVILAEAPATRARLEPAKLQAALAELLPGYLVPQHYLVIDQLPLSPNGKVDRAGLPVPWQAAQPAEPSPPRDATERQLLAIWQDTLTRSDFGVEDNFFELGGDSLHALRIIGRLRAELGLEANAEEGLQILFDHPTIATLAGALPPRPRS